MRTNSYCEFLLSRWTQSRVRHFEKYIVTELWLPYNHSKIFRIKAFLWINITFIQDRFIYGGCYFKAGTLLTIDSYFVSADPSAQQWCDFLMTTKEYFWQTIHILCLILIISLICIIPIYILPKMFSSTSLNSDTLLEDPPNQSLLCIPQRAE